MTAYVDKLSGHTSSGSPKLGGDLNRARDAPPGNMVLWRGMTRQTDIHLGFTLAKNVGH